MGAPIESSFAALGQAKSTTKYPDGGIQYYRWFEPPMNAGVAVVATPNGMVLRVWVQNDERYSTKEGLRVGSTEAQVRAVLGDPTRIVINQDTGLKWLYYDSFGMWFSIQLNERAPFYNQVWDIGVIKKE